GQLHSADDQLETRSAGYTVISLYHTSQRRLGCRKGIHHGRLLQLRLDTVGEQQIQPAIPIQLTLEVTMLTPQPRQLGVATGVDIDSKEIREQCRIGHPPRAFAAQQ